MLNYIWGFMILIAYIFAFFSGKLDETTKALLEGAGNACTLCLSLLGMMCLWCGLMKIAEKGGLVRLLAKIMSPILRLIFPDIPPRSEAMGAIVMNITANLLGLSNAATPLGLKAMNELSKLNRHSTVASNAMCMFVTINTASITLIPSTIIAIRTAANSKAPTEIIAPIWCVGLFALTTGVILAKIFERKDR